MPKPFKIRFERLLGGWAYDLSTSNSAAVPGAEDQYSKSSAISIFRKGFEGLIAPGEGTSTLTDSGSRVTALPVDGDVASNGEAFVVLANGRLVKFGLSDEVIDANYDPASAASYEYLTVKCLKVGTTEYVFSSWQDGTDADILRIGIDGSGQDDDWFSTLTGSGALTKDVPHHFCQGIVDSDMYILNGQYVAKAELKSSSPTGNTQKLNLGDGWVGTSIKRYGNYIAIGAYRATTYIATLGRSDCRVFLWDGFSPDPSFVYDVEDNYISRLNDDLSVFTQGRNNTTKLWKFTGDTAEPFAIAWETAQAGSAPKDGAADMFEGALHFGTSVNGALMASMPLGKGRYGLHYRTSLPTSVAIGMVKNLSQGNLYCGVLDGATNKIVKLNSSAYITPASLRGRLVEVPPRSMLKTFSVEFAQFGTGAALTLSLFKDYNTVSVGGATDLLNLPLTHTTLGAVRRFSFNKEIYDVSAFYPLLTFDHLSQSNTAAIVRAIEIEGETIDELIG